jgi:hypothetical protein
MRNSSFAWSTVCALTLVAVPMGGGACSTGVMRQSRRCRIAWGPAGRRWAASVCLSGKRAGPVEPSDCCTHSHSMISDPPEWSCHINNRNTIDHPPHHRHSSLTRHSHYPPAVHAPMDAPIRFPSRRSTKPRMSRSARSLISTACVCEKGSSVIYCLPVLTLPLYMVLGHQKSAYVFVCLADTNKERKSLHGSR